MKLVSIKSIAHKKAQLAGKHRWFILKRLISILLLLATGIAIGISIVPMRIQLNSTQLNSTQLNSTQLNSTQLNSTQLNSTRPTFLLIGDSITQYGSSPQGWSVLLQAKFVRSVDIHNRGLSGYSTKTFIERGLPVISNELSMSSPVLITLWYGANDAALANGSNRNQHVPLNIYRSNLQLIITRLRSLAPQSKILVITQPVIDDDRRQQMSNGGAIDRTNEQAGIYAAACADVVNRTDGVALLDIYQYLMTTYPNVTDRAALLHDGLHLSDAGNKVIYEQVLARVKTLLPASIIDHKQIP